jgi:hypothetical protein
MKLNQITLAALAVLAVGHAQAAGVTRVTGASASSIGYVEALNAACTGGVTVYVRDQSPAAAPLTVKNALGNNFTAKCASNFTGTTTDEVQIDVSGGSLNAILFSSDTRAATEARPDVGVTVANGNFLPSGTAGCTGTAGTGALNFLTGTKLQICASGAALTAGKSAGGFMDVEPAIFKAQGVVTQDFSAAIAAATFSQAFAVGVSNSLYNDLQAFQKTAAGNNLVPSTCAAGDTTPLCQPTIGKAQISALINSSDFNDAKTKGPQFLVPTTTVKSITYCRRPYTSGTQMGAEVYFLNAGNTDVVPSHDPAFISSPAAAPYINNGTITVPDGAVIGTDLTHTTQINSGTGDVKKCLNGSTLVVPGYAFGILSAENNPIGTTDTYKLVKVQGASVTAGVAGDSQTANAIKGAYDYVFESVLFKSNAASANDKKVLDLINSNVKSGAGTPGVFLNVNAALPESNFTRSGNSLAPYSSN